MQLPKLHEIWDLPSSCVIEPLARGGYNNFLFGVRPCTGAPITNVLRVYGNHSSARHIEHELAALLQLQRQKLPFSVPTPEITRRGEICATTITAEGQRLMVLLPFLPGVNPNTADLAQAEAVGRTIAQLLRAMKKLDVRGVRLPPPARDLDRVHPLITDALLAPEELGSLLDEQKCIAVQDVLARTIEATEACWKSLGSQLTHGDVIPGNVLVEGTHVTAVLDFENCALNPPAMDLAGALDTWLWDVIGRDALWERFNALGHGYSSVTRLSSKEITALPTLIRLRNAVVLMHLIGRFLGGLSPFIDVESWIE
ncbi:MAG: phosphotransferase, partial [Chloroflexi bacterium]|nr:phosphotransferase [Chloroflexota bacterium]